MKQHQTKPQSASASFTVACPGCGMASKPRNPFPTVDVVLYRETEGILLIERRNPPHGEAERDRRVASALEETGLDVRLEGLLGVYSDPDRDPRFHTLSVAFIASAEENQTPQAGDDAGLARFFPLDSLPELAFDHRRIIDDFAKKLSAIP